jgi:4-carboxymuconolactone decarboxylase
MKGRMNKPAALGFLFADIFSRDVFDHQSMDLVTISALAGVTGTAAQLRFHLGGAINAGLSEAQLKDFVSVLALKVGKEKAERVDDLLGEISSARAE